MDTNRTSALRAALGNQLRVWPLLVAALLLLAVVVAMAPAKLGLTVYGIGKLVAGAWVGYWVDRLLFPYARPHALEGIAQGAACKRRAIIVAACIVAAALIP